MFNVRMNQALNIGCNWNYVNVPYSELETVLHREASSAVAIYASDLRKRNLSAGLSDEQLLI